MKEGVLIQLAASHGFRSELLSDRPLSEYVPVGRISPHYCGLGGMVRASSRSLSQAVRVTRPSSDRLTHHASMGFGVRRLLESRTIDFQFVELSEGCQEIAALEV